MSGTQQMVLFQRPVNHRLEQVGFQPMKGPLPAGLLFILLLAFSFLLPSEARPEKVPICFRAAVTADSVNIRAEPMDSSPVVGRVWHEVGLKVTDLQSGWFFVESLTGESGWIRCDYVKTVAPCGDTPRITQAWATPGKETAVRKDQTSYRIQSGDELEIKSYRVPEINELVTVRPDGYISVLLLDDVYVQGLTPDELDRQLTKEYKKYFADPDITVLADKILSVLDRKVFIGGEVNAPMERALQTPITVLQAIIAAGGFKETAKSKNVVLIRKDPDGRPLFYKLDLSDIKAGEPIPDNLYLQPHDIVYVPATTIAKVGDFVDAYINRIVPQTLHFGFTWLPGSF